MIAQLLAVRRFAHVAGFFAMFMPDMAPAAGDTRPISQAEIMALPEYCAARFGNDHALKARWNAQMGEQGFLHVHHYCSGLAYLRRASTVVDMKKQRYPLQQAVNEFNYVLRHWPQDFYLRPMAQQQKDFAQALMGHK